MVFCIRTFSSTSECNDLDRESDFFENIIFNNRHQALIDADTITYHQSILKKKIAYRTIQLLGVMATIVSSNLQPFVSGPEAEINRKRKKFAASSM